VLKTMTKTLRQYKDAIPWTKLPKTFQDAVSFTHRLGIHFLWIDSLSIIQDSPEDWEREGSRMCSIYAGAHITLAATVSPNASEGLFRISSAEYTYQYFTYESSRGQKFDIECRKRFDQGRFDKSVLLTRAWAFQERLLWRRILHFMDDELYFECGSGNFCECARGFTQSKPDLDKSFRHCHDPQELNSNWQNMVSDYSTKVRHLTYPDDVFPALQGLAKIMPPCMGAYLAGHWERCLSQSLSWRVYGPLSPRPTKRRAPSWSWASVSSPVSFSQPRYGPIHAFFKTVSSSTVAKGSDPTGQLVSGEIVLIGQCLSGEVSYSGIASGPRGSLVIFHLNTWQSAELGNAAMWDYRLQDPGPHQNPDGTPVLLLKLDQMVQPTARQPQLLDRTWMILKQVEGQLNAYERVGLLCPDLRNHRGDHDGPRLGDDIDA
jgi:hypothetical protein